MLRPRAGKLDLKNIFLRQALTSLVAYRPNTMICRKKGSLRSNMASGIVLKKQPLQEQECAMMLVHPNIHGSMAEPGAVEGFLYDREKGRLADRP